MINPKHPAGSAFDKAGEKEEAWRQQQIAALTRDQRREFDRRAQDENKKLEAVRLRIEAQKPQRVEAEKQRLLSGKPSPELRPELHMAQNQAMSQKNAESLAKTTVEQKSKAETQRSGIDARKRLDGYLRQTERERTEHKQQDKTVRQDFNEKAQDRGDDSLTRAFQKAERQKQQSQQRTHVQATQAQGNDRERNRN